jgi:hypothetical protein
LAFISEFNVRIPYLPGLQNFLTNFLSHPSQPPKPTEDVAVATATSPVDFAEMATEQNRFLETQHLLSGSSLTIAF